MDESYEEILSGTVDEAKEQLEGMDEADFQKALEIEEENKDRKTLKNWLESRIDTDEAPEEEAVDEGDREEPETAPVESGGGLSGRAGGLLTAGIVVGLLVGLAGGFYLGGSDGPSPSAATTNMNDFVEASNFSGTVEIDGPQERNGMFFYNLSLTQTDENGTSTRTQGAYVSPDGELLFLRSRGSAFAPPNPIRIREVIEGGQIG